MYETITSPQNLNSWHTLVLHWEMNTIIHIFMHFPNNIIFTSAHGIFNEAMFLYCAMYVPSKGSTTLDYIMTLFQAILLTLLLISFQGMTTYPLNQDHQFLILCLHPHWLHKHLWLHYPIQGPHQELFTLPLCLHLHLIALSTKLVFPHILGTSREKTDILFNNSRTWMNNQNGMKLQGSQVHQAFLDPVLNPQLLPRNLT